MTIVLHLDSMKKLSEEGVSQIDMEGVNSPERGKFKLGFEVF